MSIVKIGIYQIRGPWGVAGLSLDVRDSPNRSSSSSFRAKTLRSGPREGAWGRGGPALGAYQYSNPISIGLTMTIEQIDAQIAKALAAVAARAQGTDIF